MLGMEIQFSILWQFGVPPVLWHLTFSLLKRRGCHAAFYRPPFHITLGPLNGCHPHRVSVGGRQVQGLAYIFQRLLSARFFKFWYRLYLRVGLELVVIDSLAIDVFYCKLSERFPGSVRLGRLSIQPWCNRFHWWPVAFPQSNHQTSLLIYWSWQRLTIIPAFLMWSHFSEALVLHKPGRCSSSVRENSSTFSCLCVLLVSIRGLSSDSLLHSFVQQFNLIAHTEVVNIAISALVAICEFDIAKIAVPYEKQMEMKTVFKFAKVARLQETLWCFFVLEKLWYILGHVDRRILTSSFIVPVPNWLRNVSQKI